MSMEEYLIGNNGVHNDTALSENTAKPDARTDPPTPGPNILGFHLSEKEVERVKQLTFDNITLRNLPGDGKSSIRMELKSNILLAPAVERLIRMLRRCNENLVIDFIRFVEEHDMYDAYADICYSPDEFLKALIDNKNGCYVMPGLGRCDNGEPKSMMKLSTSWFRTIVDFNIDRISGQVIISTYGIDLILRGSSRLSSSDYGAKMILDCIINE